MNWNDDGTTCLTPRTGQKVNARAGRLRALGFEVVPGKSNFIFVRPPAFSAGQWLAKLREKRLLARWFNHPETKNYLRVTMGTDAQAEALLQPRSGRAVNRFHHHGERIADQSRA